MLEKTAAIKRFQYSPVAKNWKIKLVLHKNSIKEHRTASNLVYNNYFTFYKYYKINESLKRSLGSKLNDLKEFKDKLEWFYHDTAEIKPNNGEQIKDF